MSKGMHAQSNGHPKFGSRGGRLDSKLRRGGVPPIGLRRLEELLAPRILPAGQTSRRQAKVEG